MYIQYHQYTSATFSDVGNDGQISAGTFNRLEFQARKVVDRMTQGRIKKMKAVPEAVTQLMVELIKVSAARNARAVNKGIVTSFSNDGYSETYAAPLTEEQLQQKEMDLIQEFLSDEVDDNGVPLLYLGVD